MDLVAKDTGLFEELARRHGINLELSPLLAKIFKEGLDRYGAREWSSNIIRRYEDATGVKVVAAGFPEKIIDYENEEIGYEVSSSC